MPSREHYRQYRPGCGCSCGTPLPARYAMTCPEPDVPCCEDPEPCCSHCLLAQMKLMFPEILCDEETTFQACVSLHLAERFTRNIDPADLRPMATMQAARHFLHVNALGAVDRIGQLNAIASGSAYNAPSYDAEFWAMSPYGAIVNKFLETLPVLGFYAIY